MNRSVCGACVLALGLMAVPGEAHFRLLAPASWLEENPLGDPQKGAPCGGTNLDFGKPTYAVTDVRAARRCISRYRKQSTTRVITVSRWRSIRRPNCRRTPRPPP